MKIEFITNALRSLFRIIIMANECGGNKKYVYEFNDPDGERTGKSGWSFGICQFDINNNPSAIMALREMAFTTDEISGLKAQTVNIHPMNDKLLAHASIVDAWDKKQLNECLDHSFSLCLEINVDFSSDETFMHIADYHNQFYFSRGGKLYTFLKQQTVPVTPKMILDFKYTLPWGIKQMAKPPLKDDVLRRFKNIESIMKGGHAA